MLYSLEIAIKLSPSCMHIYFILFVSYLKRVSIKLMYAYHLDSSVDWPLGYVRFRILKWIIFSVLVAFHNWCFFLTLIKLSASHKGYCLNMKTKGYDKLSLLSLKKNFLIKNLIINYSLKILSAKNFRVLMRW